MSSTFFAKAAAAVLALAAAGTATVAQARDNVYFSIGANVAPGVAIGVSNAPPVYYPPVYVQPAPVYVAPAPVYVRPAPVYYSAAPVYYGAAPVYYGPPGHRHGHRKHWRHEQHRDGYYRY